MNAPDFGQTFEDWVKATDAMSAELLKVAADPARDKSKLSLLGAQISRAKSRFLSTSSTARDRSFSLI